MFEHHSEPLLSFHRFVRRIAWNVFVTVLLIIVSLAIGTVGYKIAEHLDWVDAFYNASLILSGMGPADVLKTDSGKIFASLYSLYSGLFLIGVTGFLLAPLFHRIMHKMHGERKKEGA